MIRRLISAASVIGVALAVAQPANASPGFSWTQEKAWLAANPAVDASSIHRGVDQERGVKIASATLHTPKRTWNLAIDLTDGDQVIDETLTPANGKAVFARQGGDRATAVLMQTVYGNGEIGSGYADARLVASVPLNGAPGKQQFFATKGGSYAFMLDPFEIVVFRAADLNDRIAHAKYCAAHAECDE